MQIATAISNRAPAQGYTGGKAKTMSAISRRTFFQLSAAGAAAAALHAKPLGLPIGSQTYPHRQKIADGEFGWLCKDMVTLGVESLELCSPGYAEFASLGDGKATRQIVEDNGLKCPSGHFTINELRSRLEPSIAWAKDVGMTQIGAATLGGPVQDGTAAADAVKRLADEYNKIAETTAKAGIRLFLHNEDFEAAQAGGRPVYEILLELLDSKLVKMQLQISSMPVMGDPVAYFNKYPGRFLSMHLQGAPKAPPAARAPQVALGKDSFDWAKVFAAAKTGGVQNYFVEQPWDITAESVDYLKTLSA